MSVFTKLTQFCAIIGETEKSACESRSVVGGKDEAATVLLKKETGFAVCRAKEDAGSSGSEDSIDFAGDDEPAKVFAHRGQMDISGTEALDTPLLRLEGKEADVVEICGRLPEIGKAGTIANHEKGNVGLLDAEDGGGVDDGFERMGQAKVTRVDNDELVEEAVLDPEGLAIFGCRFRGEGNGPVGDDHHNGGIEAACKKPGAHAAAYSNNMVVAAKCRVGEEAKKFGGKTVRAENPKLFGEFGVNVLRPMDDAASFGKLEDRAENKMNGRIGHGDDDIGSREADRSPKERRINRKITQCPFEMARSCEWKDIDALDTDSVANFAGGIFWRKAAGNDSYLVPGGGQAACKIG